ncbi:MAG: helix-turn-helix transcriptional regulator [Bacteroidetes bacterium]|nr:helix-turn-helix transcriptional regulator [Bacteroidota bacterium]
MKTISTMLPTGQNIKTIRELKNLTQDYVATQLNMSVPNYSNIETGKTDVTLTRLQQIAKVLQIDYRQILNLNPSQLLNEDHKLYTSNVELREEIIKQLKIKDEQINRLLAIVEKK